MDDKCTFLVLIWILISVTNATTAYEKGSEIATKAQPDSYVPHSTFPNADTYPETSYDGYLVPVDEQEPPLTFLANIIPKAKLATQLAISVVTKVALYTLTAFSFFVVIGIMASIICTFTSVCYNIQLWIAGLRNVESMRSLVSTDSIDAAANFVQDAVVKYKRLQRAIKSGYVY